MTSDQHWLAEIHAAIAEPDPVQSNRRITQLHFALSEALVTHLGRNAGPNFHTWAVWGSRKAGVTIRQEDLGSAIRSATLTAGVVGACTGIAAGIILGRKLRWPSTTFNALSGATLGAFCGAGAGKRIAISGRARAAQLILEGNRTVLQDIGTQTARFLRLLDQGAPAASRVSFFAGLRPGPTEAGGQDRLAKAFQFYLDAFDSADLAAKREAMLAANCEIVFHEHIRLEPYIRGSMPFLVRRCATERLLTYEIGDAVLTVGADLPDVATPTAARNWTRLEQRMRYVFALFRKFHGNPIVFSPPFPVASENPPQVLPS